MDSEYRGIFATRAPRRQPDRAFYRSPCIDKGNTLYIEDIDILDGTPLLDINAFIAGI